MRKAVATAVIAMAALAGCAASGPPPLPDARDVLLRVVAIPTPINPAEYRIPGSQVFVTGTNFERSALAGHGDALVIRLDLVVVDRLREKHIGGATTDSPATVALIPKARLVRNGDTATLVCTLEAQYSVGGMASDFVHRVYSYTDPRARKLVGSGDGWIDNEGAAFHAIVKPVFVKLTDAFLADWQGRLARGTPYDLGDFTATIDGAGSVQSVVLAERSATIRR
jgi:hypothetical protein